MNTKKVVRSLLLGFVLISIGFALGKEFTLRSLRMTQASGPAPTTAPAAAGDKVIVYYVHGSIRCVTCNKIEKMTHEIVQRDFASHLQGGRIEWRTANFQTDEDLAKRFDIVSSTVVLVKVSQGRELESKKLSDVWIHVDSPPTFTAYVTGEIGTFLGGGRS